MDCLFVYGTLAPGQTNHHRLKDIRGSWESAVLKGKLVDEGWGSELGCPGIVPSEDGDEVGGYVLCSDQLTEYWAMLDEFEGDGYRRVPVQVKTSSGNKMSAYVYALNQTA